MNQYSISSQEYRSFEIYMYAVIRSPFMMTEAAFMLILRRQNQRFETLIQNADPKRR